MWTWNVFSWLLATRSSDDQRLCKQVLSDEWNKSVNYVINVGFQSSLYKAAISLLAVREIWSVLRLMPGIALRLHDSTWLWTWLRKRREQVKQSLLLDSDFSWLAQHILSGLSSFRAMKSSISSDGLIKSLQSHVELGCFFSINF